MPASIFSRVVVTNSDGDEVSRDELSATIADEVGAHGKRETVSLAAAFNALSPPTGATAVRITWASGTGALTLKGVTGDAGISLGVLSSSSPALVLPISSPSIGILDTSTGTVEVLWL